MRYNSHYLFKAELFLKRHLRDYIFLFLVAGIIIFFDQWTKTLVRTSLPPSGVWAPWHWLLPYARVVHWQNTGAAFGMLQGMNLLFSILAVIVSIAIIYYFPQVSRQDWLIRLALGIMLGGAIGNLIDRIQYGAVTDFISVGGFAVFNIADASVTVGTILLIIGMYWHEKRLESEKRQEITGEPAPVSPPAVNEEPPDRD
jgi:signal peptidase II